MLVKMKDAAKRARAKWRYFKMPEAAKLEHRRDCQGLPASDPGVQQAIELGIKWLGLAQDRSSTQDGGVSACYSLINGWNPSYPETTGYIVPTMLAYAVQTGDKVVRERAKRMLDWLVLIQFPEGGIKGGKIDAKPHVPVTFNTGQVLLGLASGVREFGDAYLPAMRLAADWLVNTQDPDGCWRKHPTPFCIPGEKAYETHVAWGLIEAARIDPGKPYADAALANVRWALTQQRDNGWIEQCCLTDPSKPLTHTLGYALRGILEAYEFFKKAELLEAGRKTADGLLGVMGEDGFLPGRLYPDWHGAANWSCLTGTVQIAICWLMMYRISGEPRYLDAALLANQFVRRTMKCDGPPETLGAIKGAFPVSGEYASYLYLNWATKFFIDANMFEMEVTSKESGS